MQDLTTQAKEHYHGVTAWVILRCSRQRESSFKTYNMYLIMGLLYGFAVTGVTEVTPGWSIHAVLLLLSNLVL